MTGTLLTTLLGLGSLYSCLFPLSLFAPLVSLPLLSSTTHHRCPPSLFREPPPRLCLELSNGGCADTDCIRQGIIQHSQPLCTGLLSLHSNRFLDEAECSTLSNAVYSPPPAAVCNHRYPRRYCLSTFSHREPDSCRQTSAVLYGNLLVRRTTLSTPCWVKASSVRLLQTLKHTASTHRRGTALGSTVLSPHSLSLTTAQQQTLGYDNCRYCNLSSPSLSSSSSNPSYAAVVVQWSSYLPIYNSNTQHQLNLLTRKLGRVSHQQTRTTACCASHTCYSPVGGLTSAGPSPRSNRLNLFVNRRGGKRRKVSELSSAKTDQILEVLKGLTLFEAAELVKQIETTFNVRASAPSVVVGSSAGVVAAAGSAGDEKGGSDEDEEKQKAVEVQREFDVIVTKVDTIKRIAMIKLVKSLTDKSLKEAKEFVDNLPQTVKSKIAKPDADVLKKQLEDAGATVQVQ
eukprot:GHVQ01020640.1.p1 GENE.GHVQ01020640.1~~GHVQ01020640.1.p1  ORF type:complete len:457 (-),score=94.38 GHVQ01020640.1:1087-2457(-)